MLLRSGWESTGYPAGDTSDSGRVSLLLLLAYAESGRTCPLQLLSAHHGAERHLARAAIAEHRISRRHTSRFIVVLLLLLIEPDLILLFIAVFLLLTICLLISGCWFLLIIGLKLGLFKELLLNIMQPFRIKGALGGSHSEAYRTAWSAGRPTLQTI